MNYIYFKIPTLYPEAETAKLNHVLSTQAIASVKEQFVDDGQNSFWSVRVAIVENATKTAIEASKSSKRGGGVDYREVLSPEIFTIYAKLRTLRNAIAEQQSIPAYAIFTNEQLGILHFPVYTFVMRIFYVGCILCTISRHGSFCDTNGA